MYLEKGSGSPSGQRETGTNLCGITITVSKGISVEGRGKGEAPLPRGIQNRAGAMTSFSKKRSAYRATA